VLKRTILALVFAPIIASITYAIIYGFAMRGAIGGATLTAAMLLIPGLTWGVGFELVVLLPLLLIMRRARYFRGPAFIAIAACIWTVLSSWLFASRQLSWPEAIGNTAMALPAGLVMISAFFFLARTSADA
jgi:hypothetical protein